MAPVTMVGNSPLDTQHPPKRIGRDDEMIEAGRILGSRYRLICPLGEGGMGTVWRAEHISLGSKVAVKLIGADIADSPEAIERFCREAKAAASLANPHVVQINDYGVDDGTPYIAMELLEGESLGDKLKRTITLGHSETLRILTHAAIALEKAHKSGIVHRDIKPDNIFLTQGYDGQVVAKILDFGVAKQLSGPLGADSKTSTGMMIGSPHYMSPEQIRSSKDVDSRTDLWALGVIAFQCFTGTQPFNSESVATLIIAICTETIPVPSRVASVPLGFDAWFAKACARDPGHRFQGAREMVEALRMVVGGSEPSFFTSSAQALQNDPSMANRPALEQSSITSPPIHAVPGASGSLPSVLTVGRADKTYAGDAGRRKQKVKLVVGMVLGVSVFVAAGAVAVVTFFGDSMRLEPIAIPPTVSSNAISAGAQPEAVSAGAQPDTGSDSQFDADDAGLGAGPDAGLDAGLDAGPDAGLDAGSDGASSVDVSDLNLDVSKDPTASATKTAASAVAKPATTRRTTTAAPTPKPKPTTTGTARPSDKYGIDSLF